MTTPTAGAYKSMTNENKKGRITLTYKESDGPHTLEDNSEVILLKTTRQDNNSPVLTQETSASLHHTLEQAPPPTQQHNNEPILLTKTSSETRRNPMIEPDLFFFEPHELSSPVAKTSEGGAEELLEEMSQELDAYNLPTPPTPPPPLQPLDLQPSHQPATQSFDDLPWHPAAAASSDKHKEVIVPLSTPAQTTASGPFPSIHDTFSDPATDEAETALQREVDRLFSVSTSRNKAEEAPPIQPPASHTQTERQAVNSPWPSVASTQVDTELAENIFLQGVLNELIAHCGRACIFACQPSSLHGLQAVGAGQIAQSIGSVLFPSQLSPTIRNILHTQQPYIGHTPNHASDQMLLACLGGPLPQQIALYPILQNRQVVAIYCLDDTECNAFLQDEEAVTKLIQRAAELDYTWTPPDLLALLESAQAQ